MFKPGDKYIHFTRYGGINTGIVKWQTTINHVDTTTGYRYDQHSITTLNNIVLQLDGTDGRIYKITKEYTKEEIEELEKMGKKLAHLKENKLNLISSQDIDPEFVDIVNKNFHDLV